MTTDSDDTAVQASVENPGDAGARADAQVRAVLGRVMAQRRSTGTALDYVRGLAPGVKANCWGLAEAAGHESPYRMQALLGSYRWDWKDLRAELPALARAWLPCDPGDLIGPGIAVDETAQLKDGDATACVAPQHAGCTGHVENCITTVFSACGWPRPGRPGRISMCSCPGAGRRTGSGAGPPRSRTSWSARPSRSWPSGSSTACWMQACPRSRRPPTRYMAAVASCAGSANPGTWRTWRSSPADFRVTLPSGAVIRADQAVSDGAFELRSCGNGSKGPRFADWALTATSSPRHFLLIRRLISRPDDLAFYLCWAPEDTPATMTFFITIAGRRWPVEQTFKTGKDTLGWDQCQARTWGRGTPGTPPWPPWRSCGRPLSATTCAATSPSRTPPPAPAATTVTASATLTCASRSVTRPSPPAAGSPARPGIAAIRLTIAETARIERLARQHAAGLITRARLAFCLRWSRWRRRHQARARWHHYSTGLQAAAVT